jgi:hypothetical protein
MPFLQPLTETQFHILTLLQGVIVRHQPAALAPARDSTIAEAAAAVAKTYETAERGIIYEHQPNSLPAQRLAMDLKAALTELSERGGHQVGRDAAVVLRTVEKAASSAGAALDGSDEAFLSLLRRSFEAAEGPAGPETERTRPAADTPSRLILP